MTLTRRHFTSLLAAAPASFAQPRPRPNFLVIMADDMGFSDIGCYGGEVATPNLDRLAQRGVRFTQFYNAARCCPTRAALLTGLYPHQAGIGHMVNDRGIPAYQGYLNQHCQTMAESLKPAGYSVMMSGKWHVGENRPHWPLDRGFDQYFGLISGASNFFRLDPGRKMALNNEPYTPPKEGFYMTNAFTDHAARMVREAPKDKPLALYLPYTAPHWPLHALPQDIEKYRGKYMKGWDQLRAERYERLTAAGLIDKRWPLSPRDPEVPAWNSLPQKEREEWDLRMAVYAAMIDSMDQGIGRVLNALQQTGRLDNTLVLFLADNGGCHEGANIGGGLEKAAKSPVPGPADSFTSYRRPWANASNTPFRMFKSWVHEGGISSPLIAAWGNQIANPGSLYHHPAHVIDIVPTMLDLAGAQYPSQRNGAPLTPLAGRSFAPALRGQPLRARAVTGWEHQGHRALRQGSLKIVAKHNQPWEMYDMAEDRTELNNLAQKDPDRLRGMVKMYEHWARQCGVEPWDKVNPPKP
ncbi:MAG: arylsulfatase [Bryobacteraceae bacterium]|nr:arylsulfatase [Bryobacteraceae bacterium]